jgi:hypothetical protein
MLKKLFLFFPFLLYVYSAAMDLEDLNASIRNFSHIDEQKVFNIVKKIYKNSSKEYIIDTTWDELKISQRLSHGYFNLDVATNNISLKILPSKDLKSTRYELQIYSIKNEKTKFITPDSMLHKLFWNRIEYALGLDNSWIDCKTSFMTIFLTLEPLCLIHKEQLKTP